MTTNNDTATAFGYYFLDDITTWIGQNLNPDDVFSDADLENWARVWAKEQDEWIPDPDQWALENGYTKE